MIGMHLAKLLGAIVGAVAWDVMFPMLPLVRLKSKNSRYYATKLRCLLIGLLAISGFALIEISTMPNIKYDVALAVIVAFVTLVSLHAAVAWRDLLSQDLKYPWGKSSKGPKAS